MMQSPQPVLESIPRFTSATTFQSQQQPAITLFAIGLIGMGILGLVVGDFALVWQPVAPWFPGRTALAYGAAGLMLLCGAGLLFRRTSSWSIRIVFGYLIVWQMLKFPALVVAWNIEGVYLGFGELAVLLAGGWTLFARLGEAQLPGWLNWITGDRGVRIARYYFAIWIIPIGLSHLIYLKATVEYVPAWLPNRAFWACLTGVGQIASGLGILFGVKPRLAAWAEAAQISLYTFLVWLPKLIAAPRTRLLWTALWISWIIGAAAWVVAMNTPRRPLRSAKR